MVVSGSPKGGRDYITPQKAIYKWYILPIGGLYATYHLLEEPETTIEENPNFFCGNPGLWKTPIRLERP